MFYEKQFILELDQATIGLPWFFPYYEFGPLL
jgi:hypothetical protein